MRIVSGCCLREILGETIVVPTGTAAEHLSGLVSHNETGALLFRALQGEQTEQTLIRALPEGYDTGQERAREAVFRFLKAMRENILLVEKPPTEQGVVQ